jgi:hypothetical protein
MDGIPPMPPRAPEPPRIESPLLANQPWISPAPKQMLPGAGFPVRPGDPGYQTRIPPAAPDPVAEQTSLLVVQHAQRHPLEEAPTHTNGSITVAVAEKRILVTFGPQPGTVVVGVEVAPDWEMETDSVTVNLESVVDLMPVLVQLARVKNMTGRKLERAHAATAPDARAADPAGAGGAPGRDHPG